MKPRRTNTDELSFGHFFPTGRTNFLYSDEAARRVPDLTSENLISLARTAEEVGFDSLFIADNWSGHQRVAEEFGHQSPAYHASLLAMAILSSTNHIGVISTLHTTHHKPAHVARMGATLDAFSKGRWGWNVVTGFSADEAALFGEEFIEHDHRYTMAAEFVDIVLQLWEQHEPIDVDGKFYRTRGRIKLPRPAQQPHPLLVSAGASPAGIEFASRYCDQLVTLATGEDQLRTLDEKLARLTQGRTVSPTRSVWRSCGKAAGRPAPNTNAYSSRSTPRPLSRSREMCSARSSPPATCSPNWGRRKLPSPLGRAPRYYSSSAPRRRLPTP